MTSQICAWKNLRVGGERREGKVKKAAAGASLSHAAGVWLSTGGDFPAPGREDGPRNEETRMNEALWD